jgi:hypothetical protein
MMLLRAIFVGLAGLGGTTNVRGRGAGMRAAHGWALVALCAFASGLLVVATPALAAKEYAQVGFFGGEGSGNGQLEEPTGVAVDGSLMGATAGDVYVIDTGNARVEQFSSAGAYISQWNGGGTPAKSFSFSSTGDSQGIAVDSSSNPLDPSAGDVYVADVGHNAVDQFGASGTYVGQLTGTCAAPGTCPGKAIPFPGELLGVAVDPSGNLWVYESKGNADEFSDTGAFVQSFNTGAIETNQGTAPGLAVDAGNGVYAVFGSHNAQKFENGKYVAQFGTHEATALTAVPATAEVLLDQGSSIERFGPVTGEEQQPPLETFAGGGLFESDGIAVNGAASATGTVYASQRGADNVEIFEYASFPGLSATFSGVSETGVTLEGTVSPKGEAITACKFEYGTTVSYGQSVPCEQTLEEINKAGEAAVVSAKLSGLAPAVTRHFRLDATNANGTKHGKDVLISRPVVARESFSNVGSGEASVAAEIDAEGLPTSYRVEYGTSEEFGSSTPAVNMGAPKGAVPVQVQLSGLQPGAEYHFRFVATDALGTAGGSTVTFGTSQSVALTPQALPDNRAYELVSAPEDTEVYPPSYGEPILAAGEFFGVSHRYRAAASGDAVAYMGDPPASGVTGSGATGAGEGNQYLATRTAKGWEASDLEVAGGGEAGIPEWRPFTADLSVWTLSTNVPITAEPQAPAGCQESGVLYSRTTSGFHSLIAGQKPGQCYAQSGGISADGSHILLYSLYAYTPQAKEGAEFEKNNLYDSVGGQLHQVNVLPDGEPEPHPDATFGMGEESNFGGDISADGSRVFWKDRNTEVTPEDPAGTTRLFVRKNDAQPQSPLGSKGECVVAGDACTVQMDAAQGGSGTSGGGVFRAASSDGSKAFFTAESRLTAGSTAASGEPDLYEYDVNTGVLTDLTLAKAGAHANVQGVVGASEDGSYVYFVADGVLRQGANGEGKEPVSGQPNVYMSHNGVTTFIVTLSPSDNNILPSCCKPSWGDWNADIGARTAEVAPGGQAVTFMSTLSLTGYDNYGVVAHEGEGFDKPIFGYQPEVFAYEAGAGRIFCASCNPVGTPPAPAGEDWGNQYGGYVGLSAGASSEQKWSSFQLHFINGAGTQVFFMTAQSLVPQDTNKRQDVYEWESDGSDGCRQTGGCVGLLSSGSSPNPAFFVDASAGGEDVFFTSRAQLVPGAMDEAVKLYDARVNGGFYEPSLACTGTGCQGVPPAPPIFATPSSVTFNGVGNFEPPAPKGAVTPRRKTAAQVRAERLARALKACGKRAKKKRAVCEKTARRRYAPAKKKGKR